MATIRILSGVNGSGKSSLLAAAFAREDALSYDPDRFAARVRVRFPTIPQETANSLAWYHGLGMLVEAIDGGWDLIFETTLASSQITGQVRRACAMGHRVQVLDVGLDSVERHARPVAARLRRDGHDIPEELIRRRLRSSPANLLALMDDLTDLTIDDNSAEGDPAAGIAPTPIEVLSVVARALVRCVEPVSVTATLRPLVDRAITVFGSPAAS